MSDFYAAQLRAQQVMHETGLSLQQLAEMPLGEWSRLMHGQTPAQAAIAAYNREQDAREHAQPQAPAVPPSAQADAPQGRTLEELALNDHDAFLQWRQNRASGGGENKGIFDSVSSQSAEYRSAARRQAGRTGWANSNVVEPPRIEGRYVRQDDMIDHRPSHQRLSNAANLWQGR